MKFIDEEVVTCLKKTNINVEKIRPNYIDEDREDYNLIIYSIPSNTPDIYADDDELFSDIILDIDIFSEDYDTHIIALKIDKELKKHFMVIDRLIMSDEANYGKYNKREITYLINV